MRSWKFLMVLLAMLGGSAGLTVSAQAAPMAMPAAAVRSDAAPLVQTARWHGRRHWHRHHGWRRHHWHRRHHWRRHYGWRRHYWHRRHHWHRRHFGYHRRLGFY